MVEQVFIVFGSLSDSATFEPILKEFQARKVPYVFHGLSAHKTPGELSLALKKTPANIFVCGAGLASALPGVVAAQTIKPVVGIAVIKDFGGLDSLLSTLQMPPGVPVLAVGPGNPAEATKHSINFLNRFSGITIVERKSKQAKEAVKKAGKMLRDFKVRYNTTFKTDYAKKTELFIDFVPFEEIKHLSSSEATVIIVPLKKISSAKDALELIVGMQSHLWVGLNRIENACLGAMQLMGFGKDFEAKLLAYRKQTGKKVLDADRKEFAAWNK